MSAIKPSANGKRRKSDAKKPHHKHGPSLLEGKFKKMGISKTNSWKTRYFRLQMDESGANLNLYYFEKESSSKPKGKVIIGIGSTIRKTVIKSQGLTKGRSNAFELCAEGNIKLIASAASESECITWINTIEDQILEWSNAVLHNLKPRIIKRLGTNQVAIEKIAGLGPMNLLRLVVVTVYHSFCVARAFVSPDQLPVTAGGRSKSAATTSAAGMIKPVAHFDASDLLDWLMDAELVESHSHAVILGSLILKHGWIRSVGDSKGQGKAESNAGSTLRTKVGSIYHFVGNFGSIVWMGWLKVNDIDDGSTGNNTSADVPFEFWQLVTTLDGLHFQKLADQASETIVTVYSMRGFSAVNKEGDNLRFCLEKKSKRGDSKEHFDIECASAAAKCYCWETFSKTLANLSRIKQELALDRDTMMSLIRAKTTHDLLTISEQKSDVHAGVIPVVDNVWSEACTSIVQQLVPIFEGELNKQPKNRTKEGKKGQAEHNRLMDTAKFQSRYFRLHLDVQIQWATQYGVKDRLYKAIRKQRRKFLKHLEAKADKNTEELEPDSDDDAFGSDDDDASSGDICRPFAYLSYFKNASTLIPQGVIAINQRCVVERIRQSVQDRNYLFKLKTDTSKHLVVDVGKSAGYRDRWIGAISNTISAAKQLEADSGFLDARKRAEEIPVQENDENDDGSYDNDEVSDSVKSGSVSTIRNRSSSTSSVGRSPGSRRGSVENSSYKTGAGEEKFCKVFTGWCFLMNHLSAVKKKIATWKKRFLVLKIHEATNNDKKEAISTLSVFSSDTDSEPKYIYKFYSKDCFKIKKYKATELYKGRSNVFKLRFFKKHINAHAKKHGHPAAKHSVNFYLSFATYKKCQKWMSRIKEVGEHAEKKSAFGDFLEDWDSMTVDERENEAAEIALQHLESAQGDVEDRLECDFMELTDFVQQHKEEQLQKENNAVETQQDGQDLEKRPTFTQNTDEVASFSLEDFGVAVFEDTSKQDELNLKLQQFLYSLTTQLTSKLLEDLKEQFKNFTSRNRLDVFFVFFNEYWKLLVGFLEALNLRVDSKKSHMEDEGQTPGHLGSKFAESRKAKQPTFPKHMQPHKSPVVDELLSVLASDAPLTEWGASDILALAGKLSDFWLMFQTSTVAKCRIQGVPNAKKSLVEVYVAAGPQNSKAEHIVKNDGTFSDDDLDSNEDEIVGDQKLKNCSSTLDSAQQVIKKPGEVRVELHHLNRWMVFLSRLFLPRYKEYFIGACTQTSKHILGLHASGPDLEQLKFYTDGTIGTSYPLDLTSIMFTQYTQLVEQNCFHVHGLMAGVLAIHAGGLLLIQEKFLDEFDDICTQMMELQNAQVIEDESKNKNKKRNASYMFFLIALINDCLLCKDKILKQYNVLNGLGSSSGTDQDLPVGVSGGSQSMKDASPIKSRTAPSMKTDSIDDTKLLSLISKHVENLIKDLSLPNEFLKRSMLRGHRDETQFQTGLVRELQDISGRMISGFMHFLFDKTNRFPHFTMLSTKEAFVYDKDAQRMANELGNERNGAHTDREKPLNESEEFVNDLKEVGNDIKKSFEKLGETKLMKQMSKGFHDFNLQFKNTIGKSMSKHFKKLADTSPISRKIATGIKRTQEMARKRLPLRRGSDNHSNCLMLAIKEINSVYSGTIARKLRCQLVDYILPIITNRLTVAYLHGLQEAIEQGSLCMSPSDIIGNHSSEQAPFVSEDGRCSSLFNFKCSMRQAKCEISRAADAFEAFLVAFPRQNITPQLFRDTLAKCVRPVVSSSAAFDNFLVDMHLLPESVCTNLNTENEDQDTTRIHEQLKAEKDSNWTFNLDKSLHYLRGLSQEENVNDCSDTAWEKKNVCWEIEEIHQALFRMALASYGIDKAHKRYYQLVWPRLCILDDWRCMLSIEIERMGLCCDIALNRVATNSSGTHEEMVLGNSYGNGVYLAAKTVTTGREDCISLDDDSLIMKEHIIQNCYLKAQCLYSLNDADQVVDAAQSLVQDDVYSRIFPQTIDPDGATDSLPSEQKSLGLDPAHIVDENSQSSNGADAGTLSEEQKSTCRLRVNACVEKHPVFQPSTRQYSIGCDFGKVSKTITRSYVEFVQFADALTRELDLNINDRPKLPHKPDLLRRRKEEDNIREMQCFIDNVVANYLFQSTFKFFGLDEKLL